MKDLLYPELSYKIIGAAMEVHRILGSGFLEKVYENSLIVLFNKKHITAEQQHQIPLCFKNNKVGHYLADIIVDDKKKLELKTVEKITNIHVAQVLNYLKATEKRLGIIINFKGQSLEY